MARIVPEGGFQLRQRMPRVRDNAYLVFIRAQPCAVPTCRRSGVEAAHIRSPSLEHGKESTGLAQKPDDVWSLPLCPPHHRDQHAVAELAFWRCHGINPFDEAQALRERYERGSI